jgi:hypothetical protein
LNALLAPLLRQGFLFNYLVSRRFAMKQTTSRSILLLALILAACGSPVAEALPEPQVQVAQATATLAPVVTSVDLVDGLGRSVHLDA